MFYVEVYLICEGFLLLVVLVDLVAFYGLWFFVLDVRRV